MSSYKVAHDAFIFWRVVQIVIHILLVLDAVVAGGVFAEVGVTAGVDGFAIPFGIDVVKPKIMPQFVG